MKVSVWINCKVNAVLSTDELAAGRREECSGGGTSGVFYYSNTHHTEINISDLTQFLTQMISTTKEKDNLINREYFQLHQPAIENLAMGGTEKYYSAGQREKSAIQFQAKMNVNKRMNLSQQKEGEDTTPLLLGTSQYVKLQTIHIDLV